MGERCCRRACLPRRARDVVLYNAHRWWCCWVVVAAPPGDAASSVHHMFVALCMPCAVRVVRRSISLSLPVSLRSDAAACWGGVRDGCFGAQKREAAMWGASWLRRARAVTLAPLLCLLAWRHLAVPLSFGLARRSWSRLTPPVAVDGGRCAACVGGCSCLET